MLVKLCISSVRFGIITALTIRIIVCWVLMPCSLEDIQFRGNLLPLLQKFNFSSSRNFCIRLDGITERHREETPTCEEGKKRRKAELRGSLCYVRKEVNATRGKKTMLREKRNLS